jgi:hypothetical protein
MKIVYTEALSVDTSGMLIQRGTINGSGTILNTYRIKSVTLDLASSSSQMCVRGVDEPSTWITLQAGEGWQISNIDEIEDNLLIYIKSATGTITVNMIVEGTK